MSKPNHPKFIHVHVPSNDNFAMSYILASISGYMHDIIHVITFA